MPNKHAKRKMGGAGGKNKRQKRLGQDEGDGGGKYDDEKVRPGDIDLVAAKEQAAALEEAVEAAEAIEKAEGGDAAADEDEEPINNDPYLLADATYIEKDTRWRNKQRTLVFCSRGVTSRFRHLCEDLRKLIPHHKTEPKFEKRSKLHEINEVCELKNCNNVMFFESRKREDLYMWLGRAPMGPTMKFQVLNIHTTGEVRLAGNCLQGSRPLLHFDKHFGEISFLKLMKTMLVQSVGTPRNHPKCKPFHDHIMSFYWLDKKVWFRHYQISPETAQDANDPEKQQLTEIGPRFVLDPIRVLSGSFSGQTLYANPHYMSPTALRIQAKKMLKSGYVRKLEDKQNRKDRIERNREEEDPLDEAFV